MITKSDKIKAQFKWTIQLFVPLLRVILSKFFYPIAYYFRVWIRVTYYNYHKIELERLGGFYPKKKVSQFEAWVATLLWFFLDDNAGEYADCGGTEFVEKYLHNDIGQTRDPQTLGGWAEWGMIIEEHITNPWRRFYCAYRWNGIRNPAYNFNRKYMMPILTDPIDIDVIIDDGRDPWTQCRFKDRDGLIDFFRSTFGKKYVFFKGSNGNVVFAKSSASLVPDFKKGTLTGYAKKTGWALPFIRHTLSWRKYHHKLIGKDGQNYQMRYLRGICNQCPYGKYKCDECEA